MNQLIPHACNLISPFHYQFHSNKLNRMHRRETVVNKRQHQVNQIRSNHQPAPTTISSKSLIHWIRLKVRTQTANQKSQTNEVEMMEHFWPVIRPNHCTCSIISSIRAHSPHLISSSIHFPNTPNLI